MKSSLLIFGAGGHAKVVAETAIATGCYSSIAFVDDRCVKPGDLPPVLGWPVIGPLAQGFHGSTINQFRNAIVAIGDAEIRLYWLQQALGARYRVPALIHPTAWVSPSAELGYGAVVFSHVTVQAQAVIGSGVILNTGCSVDHDVLLAAGVHVCPGARLAGEVRVGERSFIGIGASVIQRIHIGADVTVGAGAAVVDDVPVGVTAVGVPARVIRSGEGIG